MSCHALLQQEGQKEGGAGVTPARFFFRSLPFPFRAHLLPALAALCVFTTPPAHAHHGQEFLLLQDAVAPDPLEGILHGSYEWARIGSRNGYGLETGLFFGIAPRVALGASVEFSDGGDGWRYDSVAPFVHFQLTPSEWRVRVAVQAGYAFVEKDEPAAARRALSKATKDRKEGNDAAAAAGGATNPPTEIDPPEVGGDPDLGPDAPSPSPRPRAPRHAGHVAQPTPAAAASSSSSSDEGENADVADASTAPTSTYRGLFPEENHWFGRLIIEADLTARDKFIFNLIGVSPEHGKPAWGYAAGVQHRFSHAWAAGLEALGDFGQADEHEMVVGAYWSPLHHATFKLGAGFGFTDASPDFSVRVGLVWRF